LSNGTTAKYRSALRARDLRTLILAFIVDGAATWSYNVVLIAYIFERTHSATWITGMVTVRWIVGMVFGTYGGVLADRYDRRKVLISSAGVAMIVTLVLAGLVATDAPLITIVVASGVLAAVCTPVRPASGALIPEVVDESDLIAANSIFALLESLIVVIGPGVGALLLLTGDAVYGVLLNAASFLVSALLYVGLQVRSRGSAEPGGNLVEQWTAGVVTLTRHRKAFVLTIFLVLDSAAINAANVLMPALSDRLHGGTTGYGLLLGANALGGVIVAALANKLAASPRVALIIGGAIVVECVPLWLCAYAGGVPGAAVLQVVSGAGMVILDVLAFTALQRDLPRDVLGRVLGSVDVLLLGGSILATFVGSFLLSNFGIVWALALIGIGFPALALFGLPALRALDAETADRVTRLRSRTALLDRLDLFAGAPRAVLEQLAENAAAETVPAGTTLIAQGDPADALWVLVEGQLGVSAVLDGGSEMSLPPVDAPGYVGELGLLHRRPRSATVVTTTECRPLRIAGEDFQAALEQAAPSPMMLGRAGVRIARTSVPAAGADLVT
jgi:MFS family permease